MVYQACSNTLPVFLLGHIESAEESFVGAADLSSDAICIASQLATAYAFKNAKPQGGASGIVGEHTGTSVLGKRPILRALFDDTKKCMCMMLYELECVLSMCL